MEEGTPKVRKQIIKHEKEEAISERRLLLSYKKNRSAARCPLKVYQNMIDITEKAIKNAGNQPEVTKADHWTVNGVDYPLEKGKVFFKDDEMDRNMIVGSWLSRITGRPVELQPIVVEPKHTKTCDFIFIDDGTKVELKSFNNTGFDPNKNYINAKLGTGYGQANVFIVDITDLSISPENAVSFLDETMGYANRQFIHIVYLKKGDMLVGVYKKRTPCPET